MKKTIQTIVLAALCLNFPASAQQKNPPPSSKQSLVKGKVISLKTREPLEGAAIQNINTALTLFTDKRGEFPLELPAGRYRLAVFLENYQTEYLEIRMPLKESLVIELEPKENNLKEVEIVSTGYQNIPKERATGSFVKLNTADINRRVSTDVLSRIEDIVPGLVFNKNNSNLNFSSAQSAISIRGQSTIMGNANPLIVVDNFPYDGDIGNINPNDVASITVLKDAAAASIWGARAGNGVIVITTKRGRTGQTPMVSFNTNFTIGSKPNLFYTPQMSSKEFSDVERMLFAKGFYTTTENSSSFTALTPVIELLIAQRDGQISQTQANTEIAKLGQYDLRNDLLQYVYQKSISQQYALNISGGDQQHTYYVSAGYDRNTGNLKGTAADRFNLSANNTLRFLKDKLEVQNNLFFTKTLQQEVPAVYNPSYYNAGVSPYYPYARLTDDQGNPLAVTRDYRAGYVATAPEQGLLDWSYNPLEEMALANNQTQQTQLRINPSLKYKILDGLTAELRYQYTQTRITGKNIQSADSYYTRNLINTFTQQDGAQLSYAVPMGAIADLIQSSQNNQNARAQLSYTKQLQDKHQISAIAGYEIQDVHTVRNQNRFYGYSEENALNQPVNYLTDYKLFYSQTGSTGRIPFNDTQTDLTDRYLSYYANASYIYAQRYIISGSARLDQSNIFGVATNQKGVPLYSAGLGWILSGEPFYKLDFLPYLKLRATLGYNGNVYNKISAYTTASSSNFYSSSYNYGLTYATITNPANPQLRWERIRVLNLAVDFATAENRLSGSLEYYHKNGMDLIGTAPLDPSTGINFFTGNTASTTGNGVDFSLSSLNTTGALKWQTAFILSYNKTLVSAYQRKQSGSNYITDYGQPLEGKPLLSLYSYAWAGLDPATGDPMGYLNGQPSKNYAEIQAATTPENMIYNGPASPVFFGSLRNSFSYKNWSLGITIAYRLGYYFRKNSVNYSTVLNGEGGHGDYSLRWQKPGDEATTNVPSIPDAIDYGRDFMYRYSEVLVDRADHIRLQDINLSYTLSPKPGSKIPFRNLSLYSYVNNIGLLWKKNHFGLDPDNQLNGPIPTTYSIGLKADF